MAAPRTWRRHRTSPKEEENWQPQLQQEEQQKSTQISSLDVSLEQSTTYKKFETSNDGKQSKINPLAILSFLVVFCGGLTIGRLMGTYASRPNRMTAYNVVNEVEVTYYRDLMKLTAEVLESNGIGYWTVSGTSLGAFRNSPPGLIRWDDDMDFGILKKDMDKMMSAFKAHPEFDSNEDPSWVGYQLRLKKKPKTRKKYQMDVFVFDWFENGPYGPAYYTLKPNGGIEFPKSNYLAHEIEAPVDCPFWDLTIKCPKDLEIGLLREFGQKMMTEGLIDSHSHEKFFSFDSFKGTRFDMTQDINDHNGYLPAMNLDLLKKIKFVNDDL
mmetsp:Transcript_9961/g.21004  ORF Transcript_9961/g.21004 Transcript_9961/m.21004 type:complete len:326 (-) Transcript_9961:407-1384(-)